jgi:hypothetical protein
MFYKAFALSFGILFVIGIIILDLSAEGIVIIHSNLLRYLLFYGTPMAFLLFLIACTGMQQSNKGREEIQ